MKIPTLARFGISTLTTFTTLLVSPAIAVPGDGLEFLNVKSIAYVEAKGIVKDFNKVPISGANVVAIWTGTSYGYHSSNRHCLRIAATTTDANGSFSIVAPSSAVFRMGLAQQFVDVRVYKTSTQKHISELGDQDNAPMKFSDSKTVAIGALLQGELLTQRHLSYSVTLYPQKSDAQDRIRYLNEISSLKTDCETEGNTSGVSAYLKAISAEANSLAKTPYERSVAKNIASRADSPVTRPQLKFETPKIIIRGSSGPPDPIDPESRNYDDLTPLMEASKAGKVEEVKKLLALHANPNRTLAVSGSSGDSALALSIEWRAFLIVNSREGADRYLQIVDLLLADPRTNPNLRNSARDFSPLMKAIETGQADVVERLLKAGANPNLTAHDRRYSALGIATKRAVTGSSAAGMPGPGYRAQFQVLLSAKSIELNGVSADDGQTALTYAIKAANIGVAKQLLEAGANPIAPNRANQTPLIVATDMVKWNPGRAEFEAMLKFVQAESELKADKLN